MALTECKECGNQVSTEAETCPKCGARVSRKPLGCGAAVLIVIVVAVVASSLSSNRSTNAPPPSSGTADRTNRTNTCTTELERRKLDYKRLLDSGKFWEAARAIGDCGDVLNDAALKEMIAEAEQKEYIRTAKDATMSAGVRASALDKLARDYPAQAKPYEKLHSQLKQRAEKSEQAEKKKMIAAEAARRRKQGVSIGMTQEEVLQSSWGRPRRVNRTTYSFGTHEQWVYDGGYLYFENGVLTTIQN
jgi:hypothetical protein